MTPTAYPLQWPKGWPRTESTKRERGRFRQSLAASLGGLRHEVGLLGGKSLVLSSNYTLGVERPSDSGVVAYFTLGDRQLAIPCDRWQSVEHNVQAIALTVDAMRGMERWGAKHMIHAMFSGFKALPEKTSGIDPWAVLGLKPNPVPTEEVVTARFRVLAKTLHPDIPVTGSAEKWAELREAHDLIMAQVRGT